MLAGAVLVIAGIIGFFYDSGFDAGNSVCASGCDEALGMLATNGWQNLLYIVTGAAGLLVLGHGYDAQRAYALIFGAFYVILAALGFTGFGSGDTGDTILKLIPVSAADNLLHLGLGVLGIGAGLATPRRAGAARPAPAAS